MASRPIADQLKDQARNFKTERDGTAARDRTAASFLRRIYAQWARFVDEARSADLRHISARSAVVQVVALGGVFSHNPILNSESCYFNYLLERSFGVGLA